MSIDRRTFIATAGAACASAAAGSSLAHGAGGPLPGSPDPADSPAANRAGWGRSRFAVNIEMWWGGMSFLDKIRAAHAAGFPAVEFWPWQGKPIDEARALISELGIEVAQFTAWGFVPGLNDPKNHDSFERAIRDGCAVAKKLGCKKMTVVGGNDIAGKTAAEMHQNIIDGLFQMVFIHRSRPFFDAVGLRHSPPQHPHPRPAARPRSGNETAGRACARSGSGRPVGPARPPRP